jgi:hypothetical protein
MASHSMLVSFDFISFFAILEMQAEALVCLS